MTATTNLTPYETERNKPLPNLIHGVIQTKISTLLTLDYGKEYLFPNELSLDTHPGSTPDICIYKKRKLSVLDVASKESEAPITTIEIQSPSQSIDELLIKVHQLYFPMGVQSAWIVIPALKSIQIVLPNKENLVFTKGKLKDPVTNLEVEVERVFEDLV
ncbi:MAG: Uma2 family endonuclease [Bacteroidota bacterium]